MEAQLAAGSPRRLFSAEQMAPQRMRNDIHVKCYGKQTQTDGTVEEGREEEGL